VPLYHFLLAWAGALLYGWPSENIFVVGVTGTKGKTTTLELVNAILEAAGKKTALLSSLRVKIDEESKKNKTGNSMPGRFYIQRFLKKAVKAGCKYALIEVTSQGVIFHRHRFVNWNMGILTNIAPEHIEAHGSFEKYREAKLKFLKYVGKKRGKIFINSGDKNADFFLDKLESFYPKSYSRNDVEIAQIFPKLYPLRAAAGIAPPPFLLSDFNKDNAAAAVSVAKDLGISENTIEEALHRFSGVSGRMEFVQRKPFSVVIDYAHTPDSLEAVYKSFEDLELHIQNFNPKLICVLGAAGGGRDKWKRGAMGKVASGYCDEIVLTNEDPYDERPAEILSEIKSGIPADFPPASVHEILERKEAVKKALSLAKEGDVVIITGKGSEEWIHLARGKKIPWDERAVIEEALKNRKLGST